MKLEAELRDSFMEEAAAFDRPASQIVREFMRDFVEARRREREHASVVPRRGRTGFAEARRMIRVSSVLRTKWCMRTGGGDERR